MCKEPAEDIVVESAPEQLHQVASDVDFSKGVTRELVSAANPRDLLHPFFVGIGSGLSSDRRCANEVPHNTGRCLPVLRQNREAGPRVNQVGLDGEGDV